jgi:autotransporter-associated beta strand protein
LLKAGDFYVCCGSFAQVTSEVENGIETFTLVVVPVVTTNGDGTSGMYSPGNAADWSDELPVHEGAAYAIVAENSDKQFKALISADAAEGYVFPGQSLSLKGTSTVARSKVRMYLPVFEGRLAFSDFTDLQFSGDYASFFTLKGDIDINLKGANIRHENGFRLTVWDKLVVNVESTIRGNGSIYMCNFSGKDTLGTVILSGTNTFTGGAQLYGGEKTVCLRVSDERNLGGNPTALDEKFLLLNQGAMFYPIGSVTIDDPNRGIRFNGGPLTVKTDMGHTTTILSPVSAYSANVHVTGGGTLHIGNDSIPVAWGSFRMSVDCGFVKGGSARTYEAVKFTFAEGSGIAVDKVTDPKDGRSQYGTVLTNEATQFASSPLMVRIDCEEAPTSYDAPVPVMSIPAVLEQSLDGNVEFVDNLEMGRWYLVRDSITIDGKPFVRYSAKYEKGFAVILR